MGRPPRIALVVLAAFVGGALPVAIGLRSAVSALGIAPQSTQSLGIDLLMASGLACALTALSITSIVAVLRQRRQLKGYGALDAETVKRRHDLEQLASSQQQEITRQRSSLEAAVRQAESLKEHARHSVMALEAEFKEKLALTEKLRSQLALLEENVEDVAVGLYQPHFDFRTSEHYRNKIEEVRFEMKRLVRDGRAAVSSVQMTYDGDSRKGARLQKQLAKLLLRAFNGECDAAVAKVAWNNIAKMEERIRKGFEAINEFGSMMQTAISHEYMHLRINELRLVHEMEEKRQAEAEEQRRIKEAMREEERVQRELEKARAEAEQDERRYEKALDRAREEAAEATAEERTELEDRVRVLEQQLQEAHARGERAISQAQLTKCGHVYVISNVGSFGEDVFKIGMTRRLEPFDRVRELGDASVPFEFDVHAMIPCEDAPSLECALHREFAEHRINLINMRKEFFNVSLDRIATVIRNQGLTIEITKLAEAKEFKETLALREKKTPIPAHCDGVSAVPLDVR